MPAAYGDIRVEGGSVTPYFWEITNPETSDPLDISASGYTAAGVVSDRQDGTGRILIRLPDAMFRRESTGRLYFDPPGSTTTLWAKLDGFYQIEIQHPGGSTLRVAEGAFRVSPDLAT